jgi:hypothetical protein
MRTRIRTVVLAAGTVLLCGAGTALASPYTVLKAKVPFAFEVKGRNFPAGTYTLERDDLSPSIVLIRGEGRNHAAAFITTAPDGGHDPAGSKPVLTFKKLEHEYKLSSLWQSADEGWDVTGR